MERSTVAFSVISFLTFHFILFHFIISLALLAARNRLFGTIPDFVDQLTDLQYLDLCKSAAVYCTTMAFLSWGFQRQKKKLEKQHSNNDVLILYFFTHKHTQPETLCLAPFQGP